MTNLSSFKSILLLTVVLLITSFNFTSCKESPKKEDSKEIAEELNEPKKDATSEKDEKFLVNAAEMNLEEVQLGKLAQQKGSSADVKSLGKMMEDAHTHGLANVTKIATGSSIAVPTTPTQNAKDAYDKLNAKSGADFDKEYCDMMVKGHKDAINLYEKAANECDNPSIRSFASGTLPEIRTHLTHAEACQKKLQGM